MRTFQVVFDQHSQDLQKMCILQAYQVIIHAQIIFTWTTIFNLPLLAMALLFSQVVNLALILLVQVFSTFLSFFHYHSTP